VAGIEEPVEQFGARGAGSDRLPDGVAAQHKAATVGDLGVAVAGLHGLLDLEGRLAQGVLGQFAVVGLDVDEWARDGRATEGHQERQ